jgi:putative transposase
MEVAFSIYNAFVIFIIKISIMSGDRYLIGDQTAPYFVTFTVVDWVDVFTRLVYKKIITDNLTYCIKNKGLEVWAWCLMSNHLHAVLRAKPGYELSAIIRDYKKHSSKTIIETMQSEPESRREWMLHRFEWAGKSDKRITHYKFWQESNHAIHFAPLNHTIAQQKIDYIHDNPVRAGIVENAEDYLYSSARNYMGKTGLINVNLWI